MEKEIKNKDTNAKIVRLGGEGKKHKNNNWIPQAYKDYSNGKHTLKELSIKYKKSTKTIQNYFKEYNPCTGEKIAHKKPISLIFDATFLGRNYGILVFRANKKNLHWKEIASEKVSVIEQGLKEIEAIGHIFKSFTIDGRKGVISLLRRRYGNIPIQLCQFHQRAIVRRYTTKNPKTECGIELNELMGTITKTSRKVFTKKFRELEVKYRDFLLERNENNQFMHKRLRSAFRSIRTNLPYLFTYLDCPNLDIPNTTNTCEGSFSYWKQKVKIHRGLGSRNRKKMIDFF